MKLMNANEEAPEEYFIFVNRLNPLTRNNFDVTGTFTSAAFGLCTNEDFLAKYLQGSATYIPFQPYRADCTAIAGVVASNFPCCSKISKQTDSSFSNSNVSGSSSADNN